MTAGARSSITDARQAETRVLRTIVVNLGVSTLVFLLLTLGAIQAQWPFLSPLWSVPAVAVIFGLPPVLAIVCFFMGVRTIKAVLGAYALYSLAMCLGYLVAMSGWPMPFSFSPWPLGIVALSTVPAALAFRSSRAWLFLVASAFSVLFVRYFASSTPDLHSALQDAMFTLTFTGIFTALAIVTMRSAVALDQAATTARATAVRRAVIEASQREQARLDALLHDDVMTTLFYASTGAPELETAVRRQAAHALAELGRVGEETGAPVEVAAFTSRLRSVALDGAGAVAFSVRGTRTRPVPAIVDAAFAEAAAEAMRNSLIHAAPQTRSVRRSTTVTLEEGRILVAIEDDGVGFDARDVRPHRLGILVSIRGRMSAIAGGSARIESSPGRGVLVELEWRQS